MINKPRAWATIFATRDAHRSFVETCLERSYPAPLEVTVCAPNRGSANHSCTCDRDNRSRLVANEAKPCERHFIFEPLAETRHWSRIHSLDIVFISPPGEYKVPLVLGSCRFFKMPSLRLTHLKWTDLGTPHAEHLFLVPPFVSTLRSLSFHGFWDGRLIELNNLTSFTLWGSCGDIDAESFRAFILNNQSLETLSLETVWFEGGSGGHPVILPNLKSLHLSWTQEILSTLFLAPALKRLSSLSIFPLVERDESQLTLRATGEGITFTANEDFSNILRVWQDVINPAKPTIQHVRLGNPDDRELFDNVDRSAVLPLLKDVHTLEIGRGYAPDFYPELWANLREFGPQLRTIRFEVQEETEPLQGIDEEYECWGGDLLNHIEELVAYRSGQGRPFSTVERMVVSESEWVNRQQEFVWRCFYNDRRLDRYLQPQ